MKASVANDDMVVSANNDGSLMAEIDTEAWMAAYQEQEAALVDLTCFVAALQVIISFNRNKHYTFILIYFKVSSNIERINVWWEPLCFIRKTWNSL